MKIETGVIGNQMFREKGKPCIYWNGSGAPLVVEWMPGAWTKISNPMTDGIYNTALEAKNAAQAFWKGLDTK